MSNRQVLTEIPPWWPPKVGDKLRMYDNTYGGAIARLCHVVSVFRHDQKDIIAIAYYGIYKQWWHYEVVGSLDANWKFWPDGEECPHDGLRENLRKSKESRDDD